MASEHHVAAGRLFAENAQSHLLKLPGELRNRIYQYALTADGASRNRELHAPRRPALLQVCRQLRNETRLFYFWLNRFRIIVKINNTDEVHRWAAAITDEELHNIPSLTFKLRTKYGRLTIAMVYRQFDAIDDFNDIIKTLKKRCCAGKITVVRERAFEPRASGGSYRA